MNLPPKRSEEDIRHLAEEWVAGRVYALDAVPADIVPLVFMPLGFGALKTYSRRQLPRLFVFAILNEHAMAGRGVNGFPMFTECAVWRRTDGVKANALAQRMQEAMDGA